MKYDQYTSDKVQPKDFVSGWIIAFLIAGTGLTLPMFFLGSEIALSIGFKDALIAFSISTLILTIFSSVTTRIGNRSRLSTYMILHFSFGRKGTKIINLIFGFALLGWYSFALELLAGAIGDMTSEVFEISLPQTFSIILVSLLIIFTTLYGIQRIEKLNNITVPIITVFFCYVLYECFDKYSPTEIWNFVPSNKDMTLFDATTILVESSILFPILMADFSRFARNDRQSLIAVLGIAFGFPIALIFCAIPAILTGEVDIMRILFEFKLIIPAFGLLFISTWAANSSNLYSAVLTVATIKTSWSFKSLTLLLGILGSVMALFEFSKYLFDFLNLLGVLTPAISSIYIIDFFLIRKQQYVLKEIKEWGYSALVSWVLSSTVSAMSYYNLISITGMYFLDAFLSGGILYVLFKWKSVGYKSVKSK
ncbi:cytosine permease [Ekhidna sp.]|uniref:purine-cytosine permease family protein n=1 Tax=Ekhidna sp. TaxID=2608089 RepID=UPI003297293A